MKLLKLWKLWKTVVVCMNDNCFFCSFSCSVQGPLIVAEKNSLHSKLCTEHLIL